MSRSFGATSLTMRSPMKISPLVCSSRPASIRRAVVFPQPDGPTSTRNSASRTARLRSLTATTSPKRFVTWSYVTVAIESKSMSWDFAAEARVRTRVGVPVAAGAEARADRAGGRPRLGRGEPREDAHAVCDRARRRVERDDQSRVLAVTDRPRVDDRDLARPSGRPVVVRDAHEGLAHGRITHLERHAKRAARRDREEIALDPPRAARRDAHDEGLAVALEEAARRRAVETWLVVGRGRHAKEHERQRGGDREERSRHARTVRDRGARVCPHFVPSRRHFVRTLSSFFAPTSRGGLRGRSPLNLAPSTWPPQPEARSTSQVPISYGWRRTVMTAPSTSAGAAVRITSRPVLPSVRSPSRRSTGRAARTSRAKRSPFDAASPVGFATRTTSAPSGPARSALSTSGVRASTNER